MATPISELGEFGLIEYLTQNVKHYHKSTIKGIGDDASVHSIGGNKVEVITNDLLLEGIHFDLTYMPLKHLGYKAVVVNVSDIYAMNATPKRMVLGLGISKKFSIEALNELYEGILLACKRYNIDFVGGDTSASLTGLTISITVLGDGNADEISYRSGAKEKNLICVSGDLGGAYLGVQILEREKRILKEIGSNNNPQLEKHKYTIGRQLKPEARREIITFFKEKNIVLAFGTSRGWDCKKYPIEKWINVINNVDVNFLLIWGNDKEKKEAEYIASKTGALILPKLSFNDLKYVIKKSDLIVGNDTGPTHIGWAIGTKSLIVFGCTDKNLMVEDKAHLAVKSDSIVNYCKFDKNDLSIRNIDEKLIIKKIKELI